MGIGWFLQLLQGQRRHLLAERREPGSFLEVRSGLVETNRALVEETLRDKSSHS